MKRKRDAIGDLYQRWTKYQRDTLPKGGLDWASQPALYKEFPSHLKRIPIPPLIQFTGKSLWKTMTERRSIREYTSDPITFEELSIMIWSTQGITSKAWGHDFRTVPSAGALYPIETYLIVHRVEKVSPGIYHSSVKGSYLVLLKEGYFGPAIRKAGLGQGLLEEAACVFVWTAVAERSKWKYRERAYRYIYMDAGHIGQNLYLAATGLGLGCCTVGAFFDEEVDRIIGIDGDHEFTVYLGAVGRVK